MIKKASYARRLGIDLASKNEEELFKWFLACLLFGKPIQTAVAERAYQELVAARLTSPSAVLRAGWDKLVRIGCNLASFPSLRERHNLGKQTFECF